MQARRAEAIPPGSVTKRLIAAPLLAFVLFGTTAGAEAAEYGTPPSGSIPIIFNDHTVYAKPDVMLRHRVLAALVRHGHVYVPLRSMFEEMGATVTVSPDGKTIGATKSGASVSVTVGSNAVIVNGETRPLDVPPIVEGGIVLVPVRVLSEALGAYVQWLPSRQVVVVRYLPAPVAPPSVVPFTPIIPPEPSQPSSPPAPTPSPAPVEHAYGFIAAAFAERRNYNEFSAGEYCPESYTVSGAYAFGHSKFALKVDFRQDVYVTSDQLTDAIGNHYTSVATIDGGTALTPVFQARQSSLDGRLEYQIAEPRVYIGVGYLHTANNYGYPHLNAVGAGIEKLPDLHSGLSFFGSAFYYPVASGSYTIVDARSVNVGATYQQRYSILKYDVGLAFVPGRSPLYLYGGLSGDRYHAQQAAPIGQIHDGPYLGLGLKL